MNFGLTDEQSAIFDLAVSFGAEYIAPFAREWETAGSIPKELWPKLAELGFGGLNVSEENGGTGLSRLDATLVFEALLFLKVNSDYWNDQTVKQAMKKRLADKVQEKLRQYSTFESFYGQS